MLQQTAAGIARSISSALAAVGDEDDEDDECAERDTSKQ